MIGGLSRTATAALRQLLDAGTLSNLPAGFKQRGIRVRDEAQPLQPGEFRDVDAPGGNLRDAFMPLPFKEPSGTLLQLMGVVVQAGQRFASIADMQVGDGIKAQQWAQQLRSWSVDRGLCLQYTKIISSDEMNLCCVKTLQPSTKDISV